MSSFIIIVSMRKAFLLSRPVLLLCIMAGFLFSMADCWALEKSKKKKSRTSETKVVTENLEQGKAAPSQQPAEAQDQSKSAKPVQWATVDPLGGQTILKNVVQIRPDSVIPPIDGLRWKKMTGDLVALPQAPGSQDLGIKAIVEGYFERPGWSLLWRNQKIVVDELRRFRLRVRLAAQSTVLNISSIGPTGEVQEQSIVLIVENWEQLLGKLDRKPVDQRTFVSVLLSLSTISYNETLKSTSQSLIETALTARVSYSFFLKPPRWDLGVSSYFTLLPLSKSQSGGLRFLGINFRVGYLFPSRKDAWAFGLYGGAYYTTTFMAGNGTLGFENMQGPQLYPVVRKQIKKGTMVLGYLKFSPMSSQYGYFTFSSHELAFGGMYSDLLNNGHPLSFSLDISRLFFDIPTISFKGASNTASIGVGYGF